MKPSEIIGGRIMENEGKKLAQLAFIKNDGVVLELGSLHGCSTAYLASGSYDTIFTVDIKLSDKFFENMYECGIGNQVFFMNSSSMSVMWSLPIRLLFIDTVHTPKYIGREFKKYYKYIIDGGYICFHDVLLPVMSKFGKFVVEFVERLPSLHVMDKVGTMLVVQKREKK